MKAAVLEVGGWFDAEDLSGPVQLFHSIDKLSPEAPENTLIEGPWVHGGWSRGTGASLGDIKFGDSPSAFYRDNIETPFFAHWLKNKPWTALPKAYTFETGSNVWKKYDAWPIARKFRESFHQSAAARRSKRVGQQAFHGFRYRFQRARTMAANFR